MSFTLKIDILKGRENYNSWSRMVRAYLISEGLWNTVRTTNSTDVEKNLQVKYIITCLINDDLLETIDSDAMPNAIWTSIHKQCTTT